MSAERVLLARLERLEGIVGGGNLEDFQTAADGPPRDTLGARVAALSVRLAELGSRDPPPRVAALAERAHGGHTGADAATTRAVLAASGDRLGQTAQQLEKVYHLSAEIGSEGISEVAAQRAEVDRVAPYILSQASSVADLGRQLEAFLESYNDAAASMSECVLQLDARVRRLEQRRSAAKNSLNSGRGQTHRRSTA